MRKRLFQIIRATSVFGLGFLLLIAAPLLPAADKVDYLKEIKPIFAEKCYACHSSLKQEAELRLETRELMLNGGDSGSVLKPGKPAQSLILERILAKEDEQMPPPEEGSRLTDHEITLIKAWIAQGAITPKEEIPGSPKDHWAFQPPVKAKIPGDSTTQNPIDAFLEAQRQKQGIVTVSPASKRVLLRRVYIDLIGLPPTQEELRNFVNDSDKDAYQKVVRKLLASPQHGERWGRHWMDIWRYTDWYGLGKQLRYSQKHIWHWRDWIVESLNRDSSYAEMVQDMLAADELKPTDHEALRATGFLARHYYLFNRTTWLDSTLEHTSKAFLGLTMNCAKCHDHKYDPLTHQDYYQMRAIFEPYQVRLDALPGETNLEKNGLPRIFDAHADAKTYLHIRGNEKEPDESQEMQPAPPELFTFDVFKVSQVNLPPEAHHPGIRDFVLKDQLKAADVKIATAEKSAQQAKQQLAKLEQAAQTELVQQKNPIKVLPFLIDDFKTAQPELWTMGPGQWAFQEGKLIQTKTGYGRAYLRTKQDHPQNFKATFKFKTTGGDKWRSVGLAFDVTEKREKMIYLSAVQPGSKLQVSYNEGSKSVYPAEARHGCEVNLNEPYELEIKVRDQLVNVALNGEHAISYRLPLQRESGKIDLLAFDAAAEFEMINVSSLSADEEMIEGKQTMKPSLALAKAKSKAATLSLQTAQLSKAALQTAFAADKAQYAKLPEAKQTELTQAAALAARKYELAQAEEKLAKAEEKLEAATGAAKKKVEKEIAAAKKQLATAKQALNNPGEKYTRVRASLKALEGPAEKEASRLQPYPQTSTGRRAAFARWVTHRQNPLTARVAVNHIWLRHFGQPLVEDVTDFGLRSKQPLQHHLLDWLAVEFMEHNWSMKHLHELMTTSKAYQLSSSTIGADQRTQKKDSENHYYWRHNIVRMESEIIRDSLLHLAGELDLTRGGPTIDPAKNPDSKRRSMYFTTSRDAKDKFLSMFDAADIFACYRRNESVVPQQALALANSKVSLQMARKISEQIRKAHPELSDQEFVKHAYEKILCVEPTPQELAICLTALTETQSVLKTAKNKNSVWRSRENLVHALLNHNDFITIR
ncbi:PSD1 and planctomycete cytochrome C domain-containing protein [Gimesia fumaroli]|uniref:Planctomycete cytochrome C n=1 Tax=Gimesia fumaroli TaxID=2527976 RepID=A0A518IJ74_9PLAN|nr:PSD1 and planctomycete cytochrome C domain-containing protein [Gimesia fumaroli]QDV53144.1 Planctomycete cytochrome C [Gimesia fumaroli]